MVATVHQLSAEVQIKVLSGAGEQASQIPAGHLMIAIIYFKMFIGVYQGNLWPW